MARTGRPTATAQGDGVCARVDLKSVNGYPALTIIVSAHTTRLHRVLLEGSRTSMTGIIAVLATFVCLWPISLAGMREQQFSIVEAKPHSKVVTAVRFFRVGKEPFLLSAGWDERINILDLTLRVKKTQHVPFQVRSIALSDNGKLVAACGVADQALVLETSSLLVKEKFSGLNITMEYALF